MSKEVCVLSGYPASVLPNSNLALLEFNVTLLPIIILEELDPSLVSWIAEIPVLRTWMSTFGFNVPTPIWPWTWSLFVIVEIPDVEKPLADLVKMIFSIGFDFMDDASLFQQF